MSFRLFIQGDEKGIDVTIGPIPRIGEKLAYNDHFYTVMNVSYAIKYNMVTLVAVSVR